MEPISLFSLVESIEIYFLVKGHTHGQIDQLFSRLALWLKRLPAKTLAELRWSLYQCYNRPSQSMRRSRNPRKPQVARERVPVKTFIVDSVVDVANWLAPINPHKTGKLNGQNTYNLHETHAFRLDLVNDGDVQLSSKTYARDEHWQVNIYLDFCSIAHCLFL